MFRPNLEPTPTRNLDFLNAAFIEQQELDDFKRTIRRG